MLFSGCSPPVSFSLVLLKFLILGVVYAKTSFGSEPSAHGAKPGSKEAVDSPIPIIPKINNSTKSRGESFGGLSRGGERKGYDYGDPKYGCMVGEQPMQVLGVAGEFCSPECTTSHSCPTLIAPGVSATPQCALTTSSEQEFCVLICMSTNQCAAGAICHPISGVGICTFTSSVA
mmetsp:Transcript_7591/g.10421  ORF Transcript_7591/g.10421 Transcript_7591/m.10421 type:complete len:175 (-) Transcript_7591:301-825(-)